MPQNIGLKFVKNNSFHVAIGQVPEEVISARQAVLISFTIVNCYLELRRESEEDFGGTDPLTSNNLNEIKFRNL
jgi:hypothetical protein